MTKRTIPRILSTTAVLLYVFTTVAHTRYSYLAGGEAEMWWSISFSGIVGTFAVASALILYVTYPR
jgi:hypothetical protein